MSSDEWARWCAYSSRKTILLNSIYTNTKFTFQLHGNIAKLIKPLLPSHPGSSNVRFSFFFFFAFRYGPFQRAFAWTSTRASTRTSEHPNTAPDLKHCEPRSLVTHFPFLRVRFVNHLYSFRKSFVNFPITDRFRVTVNWPSVTALSVTAFSSAIFIQMSNVLSGVFAVLVRRYLLLLNYLHFVYGLIREILPF